MVRETRHLWVGNLPDNIREDRIREHFKRYGRVQNVKLLGRTESPGSGATPTPAPSSLATGLCAAVAFMDIKSASKAHTAEHVLDERSLTTEYYEPVALPAAATAPSAGSSPAGSGYSGSSCSLNSAPVPAASATTAARYHLSGEESVALAAASATWRGTNDSATEYCRRGSTPAAYTRYQRAAAATPPGTDRTPHQRWYAGGGSESAPSTPGGAGSCSARRRRSGSGGSQSSRSSSSSDHSSDSRASTPAAPAPSNATPTHNSQWASTASGRPLAICVRNLPTRSSDSSLKDGLYHEYKKHGKVVWVKVVGQNAERYAVVRFKKPSDVEKALEVSQDKLFFGCKISVAPHQNCDEDAESAKPYETDIDEYHPKATRTLFIGNLEKEVTQLQLRDKFKRYGRIIEIDIKKGSGGGAGYAFCQYASISSVVDAIKAMDGEYVGSSRVKLGFGKPVATTCVWVDGLTELTEKQVLSAVSRCGAATSVCVDRAAGAALVHFEQAAAASAAVRELRRHAAAASAEPDQRRLMVDYASRECQEAFYEQLEKHGGCAPSPASGSTGDLCARYAPPTRHDTMRYESCTVRGRSSSYGRGANSSTGGSRTPRYSAHEQYEPTEYAADRRYRVYEDLESSPPNEDATYEDRLQSVVVSPHRAHRHRHDSSPDEHRHSKERHRSNGPRRCSGDGRHRSRSGSRSEHRRRGSDADKRRHRRRRDESGSRAGTPLFDELPDGPVPSEPRRPPLPRDRSHLPISLPLPKFAAQLLRTAHNHAPPVTPTAAPASPSRPPSASSSSGGSAPHSPSLEERIRSLDEKYEKWSGSRSISTEAADRGRFRHRLLELDINEVKPSEVVRSLLAKRSVFDEDSERLEGTVQQRPPSPSESPKSTVAPRALQYPFPTHPPTGRLDTSSDGDECLPPNGLSTKLLHDQHFESMKSDIKRLESMQDIVDTDCKTSIRKIAVLDSISLISDPRLNKSDKLFHSDQNNDGSFKLELNQKIILEDKSQAQYQNRVPHQLIELKLEEVTHLKEEIDQDDSLKKDHHTSENQILNIKLEGSSNDPLLSHEVEVAANINTEVKNFHLHSDTNKAQTDKAVYMNNKLLNDSSNLITGIKEFNETYNSKNFTSVQEQIINDMVSNVEEKNSNIIQNKKKAEDDNVATLDNSIQKSNCNNYQSTVNINESSQIKEECVLLEINHEVNSIQPVIEITVNKLNSLNVKDQNEEHSTISVDKVEKMHMKNEKCAKEKYTEEKYTPEKNMSVEKGDGKCEKLDVERNKVEKDKMEKEKHEKGKSSRTDKEKRYKDEADRSKIDRDKSDKDYIKCCLDKVSKDRDEKFKYDDKSVRNHDKKDKKKDITLLHNESFNNKCKKEERHKYDKYRKEQIEFKRELKKDHDIKSRKSSREESTRDLNRKDSTDSSASRTSHDSSKVKEYDSPDCKDEIKIKTNKHLNDHYHHKQKADKEINSKCNDKVKFDDNIKIDVKEEKDWNTCKKNKDIHQDSGSKCKTDLTEKPRHYSVDSPKLELKRKERLNSCSSLPSNIGTKRRMSSQDSFDSLLDDNKKIRHESRIIERRKSKDSRNTEKHKTPKFNKGHFAKLLESKTKDDKKNQVKPPDETSILWRDNDGNENTSNDKIKIPKSPKHCLEDKISSKTENLKPDGLQNHLDFLATLELRSSEEDEKQKALRKELKEKKRIQQLQQIQELQMQQVALQHADLMNRKEEKKHKNDDKKKEISREKRLSTDRKSREEKLDTKRKNRKQISNSSDTSDSDEPKKHSIFDIVDDEPTYISMYDKVKARSCKNMQKQEEEKRQEKIKAKFSQLKQSRAKREEKKRSSWDEDSDSDHEINKSRTLMTHSSSEDEHVVPHNAKEDTTLQSAHFNENNVDNYCELSNHDKLSRKNSRSRIISDSSDNESLTNSHYRRNNIKEELESLTSKHIDIKSQHLFGINTKNDADVAINEEFNKNVKKGSATLYHIKTECDDSKLNCRPECEIDYKSIKHNSDISSENESLIGSKERSDEAYRKRKKKQKKEKNLHSDEDAKFNVSDLVNNIRRRHSFDKVRKHSNRREKRRDRLGTSTEVDDIKDDRSNFKTNKKIFNANYDKIENHIKKDGKMEDIFGPLSDESDVTPKADFEDRKVNYGLDIYNTHHNVSKSGLHHSNNDFKLKDKEEMRRRKEKRRKEKRHSFKEDENSLDVDAVGKAIEARLFEDTMSDDNVHLGIDIVSDFSFQQHQDTFKYSDNTLRPVFANKHNDHHKKDNKEKRKRKKRNKDEKQKHHHNDHHVKFERTEILLQGSLTSAKVNECYIQNENLDSSIISEFQSLPRLTDSPPPTSKLLPNQVIKKENSLSDCTPKDIKLDDYENNITVNTNIIVSIEHSNISSDENEHFSNFDEKVTQDSINAEPDTNNLNISDDAIRILSEVDNSDNIIDNSNIQTTKSEEKVEEKPRAVISQEETEDAVAALLGESFGGKGNPFGNCYNEEVDNTSNHIENASVENENILEEDAEEMRQAVQNLNASEMEIKPDTPVSDNDHLLIDTDTEDTEELSDTIDKLNMTSSTSVLNENTKDVKTMDNSNIVISKPNQITNIVQSLLPDIDSNKIAESEPKLPVIKRETINKITSTGTPVITSWTVTNNKLQDARILNIKSSVTSGPVVSNKVPKITTNIVQVKVKPSHIVQSNNSSRPIIGMPRMSTPYQVINQMNLPMQAKNIQPPIIKIPESHVLYQKQQSIVLSPRLVNDVRLSPKANIQIDAGVDNPRLTNMTILGTSPQNKSSQIASPNMLQQRSPGHVTVVHVQQPPSSPIQSVNIPQMDRTLVSSNRSNSVLVPTQASSLQYNRVAVPVTPILAPLSKQSSSGNMLQQNKVISVPNNPLVPHQKVIISEARKPDSRSPDYNEQSKMVISSSNFQQGTNSISMTQNRLNAMQSSQSSNINTGLHISNKVQFINNVGQLPEKRDNPNVSFTSEVLKTEINTSFGQAPFIHVGTVANPSGSIIQCKTQIVSESFTNIHSVPKVIQTLHSQRSVVNVKETFPNKASLPVTTPNLSTVFTKLDSSNVSKVTPALNSVVMTPLLLKTTLSNANINTKSGEINLINRTSADNKNVHTVFMDKRRELFIKPQILCNEMIPKCETDFEELLKDNTNEIKITNEPDKKLEVNIGKTITQLQPLNQLDKICHDTKNETRTIYNLETNKFSLNDTSAEKNLNIAEKEVKMENIPNILAKEMKTPNDISDNEGSSIKLQSDTIQDKNIEIIKSVENYSSVKALENSDNTLNVGHMEDRKVDEIDTWSAKDVNIDSVIKKVDSLCNDISVENLSEISDKNITNNDVTNSNLTGIEIKSLIDNEKFVQDYKFEDEKSSSISRRGRGIRGKRLGRGQERVQTRLICKPVRRGTITKRGRGRGKVENKIKNAVNTSPSNIPGDIYDFHEDSGDESTLSPTKAETRPRLILTIKSPLTGNSNITPTSTLSISPQLESKEEKAEDFVSPSLNTRKSRRLQEKDVHRNVLDDVVEDIKSSSIQTRTAKELNIKKRATRQTNNKMNHQDKSDMRKSPRGVKRTKQRSSSDDASLDSNSSDEKLTKIKELPSEAKIIKVDNSESIAQKSEPITILTTQPSNPPVINSLPATTPTPIMRPPKKMISEISAKLGAALFESSIPQLPIQNTIFSNITVKPKEEIIGKIPMESEKLPYRDYSEAAAAAPEEILPAATAEPTELCGRDMGFVRRMIDSLPGNMMPVGAMEATDARVQSPALPHRPPSANVPSDRATPILIRGGESSNTGCAVSPRVYRAPYATTASLPRGAHHPPPQKPLATVGPHHHHTHLGSSARVTITSVPAGSPQGQIGLSSDSMELVRIPPPAHQQTSPITPGDAMYPHFSHQHYQMYQQHFRATQQDSRASPSPYTRTMEPEATEAPAPPLELRRPPSARVPRPAHSPSHADRLIRCRSPPPAHAGVVSRLPAALPPLGPPGPPHASQVPHEADSLQMLLRRYPVMWQGLLALKNDSAAVQMHFVHGNAVVAVSTLPRHTDGSTPPLRIAQRMRLEPTQLDQVHRKMKMENEHCMLLALPCGRDHMDVLQQSTNLNGGFITYLQRKQAAGIVNVAPPGHQQAMYTVHIFPSCDFANENLNRIAPDLMHRVADIAHLLIVIATV